MNISLLLTFRAILIGAPLIIFLVAQTSRLHDAVRKGGVEAVSSALKPWKSLDAINRQGRTPLGIAIERGDLPVVTLLLDRGASIQPNDTGHNSDHLIMAVSQSKYAIVKLLLDRGARVDTADRYSGSSALHEAVSRADIDTVLLLLARGAPANILDRAGRNPLFQCFGSGPPELRERKLKIAEVLLAHGADISQPDRERRTLLDGPLYALPNSDLEQLRFLLDHKFPLTKLASGASPLHYAARARKLEAVKLFLEYGADANDSGDENAGTKFSADRSTALHEAANLGSYASSPGYGALSWDIVMLLIAHGAKVNVRDTFWNTPLLLAAHTNNVLVVQALLRAGADPNLINRGSLGPLDMAATQEIAEMLQSAGACRAREQPCKAKGVAR
jgi:ankyrin repeat protein